MVVHVLEDCVVAGYFIKDEHRASSGQLLPGEGSAVPVCGVCEEDREEAEGYYGYRIGFPLKEGDLVEGLKGRGVRVSSVVRGTSLQGLEKAFELH